MKRILCVLCMVTLMLSAAGSTWAEGEGFTPALDTSASITLLVAGHYDNFEAIEAEFALFRQYYPNVKLKYEKIDDYNNNIGKALRLGEEAPDIFFTYPSMVGQERFVRVFDAVEDLSDPALGLDLSGIRSHLLLRSEDGKVFMLPIFCETYGMLVNEDVFEKENLQIPGTYEQLLQACEALKSAGYSSPMLGFNGNSSNHFLLYPLFFPYFLAQIRENETAIADLNSLAPSAGEYMRGALELAADFISRGYMDLEECNLLAKDYDPVILRFFEGDVPMMLAKGGTVSGTEKRESRSEAFQAHPFRYSFHPVPSTDEGGYFMDMVSMGFSVNRYSEKVDMANEFIRFLVSTNALNRMAQAKRMVTPCKDTSLDKIYAAFGKLPPDHTINLAELGLADAPDTQVRKAGWLVSNGMMTVDEAVAAFGTIE